MFGNGLVETVDTALRFIARDHPTRAHSLLPDRNRSMKKLSLAIAAGVAAASMAFAPALSATAAPAHTTAKAHSKHYTLSVDGNGKHATVVWTTLTVKSSSASTTVPTPVAHTVAKAHEPWRKHVKAGASLYEIVAVQTTGSKLSCTIKNTHGTVVARSRSRGRNTIVTCIVAKDALLAGVGGSSTTSGSGATPSLQLSAR
jgi:hypothetical protein